MQFRDQPPPAPSPVAAGASPLARRLLAASGAAEGAEEADLARLIAELEGKAGIPLGAFEAVAGLLGYLIRLDRGAA